MSSFGKFLSYFFVVSVVTFFILLGISFSSLQVNEFGLDYSAISKKIYDKPYVGGIYFIGVGHSFIKFPRTVQTIEYSKENRVGQIKSRTSDGLEVNLEISFQFKLMYEKLFSLYNTYGDRYHYIFERVAMDVLT